MTIEIALSACEKWIKQPDEESRRAAMAAAEKAQFSTSTGTAPRWPRFSAEAAWLLRMPRPCRPAGIPHGQSCGRFGDPGSRQPGA